MKLILMFMIFLSSKFLLPIIASNLDLNRFKYIKTFEMENGKILFCTEKGIALFTDDPQRIEEINETKFTPEVSKDDFDFVTISKFEEGEKYIIVAYKEVIFIFTSEGEYFTKGNLNFTPQGKFYTLVPYKTITNNEISEYHFIIGYLGNESVKIFLLSDFSFANNTKNVNLKSNIALFLPFEVTYSQNGFSCNLMKSSIYNEVLTCFFLVINKLTVSSFKLDNFTQIDNLTLMSNIERAN